MYIHRTTHSYVLKDYLKATSSPTQRRLKRQIRSKGITWYCFFQPWFSSLIQLLSLLSRKVKWTSDKCHQCQVSCNISSMYYWFFLKSCPPKCTPLRYCPSLIALKIWINHRMSPSCPSKLTFRRWLGWRTWVFWYLRICPRLALQSAALAYATFTSTKPAPRVPVRWGMWFTCLALKTEDVRPYSKAGDCLFDARLAARNEFRVRRVRSVSVIEVSGFYSRLRNLRGSE